MTIKPMRRKDREVSSDAAWKILKQCPYATLSMCTGSQPYAVPISPAAIDGTVYFHCARQGQKIEFLRQNPSVCLTCVALAQPDSDSLSMFYQSATAYGTAHEVTGQQEKRAALLAISQKYCPKNIAGASTEIEQKLNVTAVYKIVITHITGKSRG